MSEPREFIPLGCAVLTISDTRSLSEDRSGGVLVEKLTQAGHRIEDRAIVKDDPAQIQSKLRAWIQNPAIRVMIATGGTGFTARDQTPEAVAPLITKPIPGFGELFRMISYEEIGVSTIQSRALGGLCDDTLLFVLPGSPNACKTAMDKILLSQLDHRHRPCNFVQIMDKMGSRATSEP